MKASAAERISGVLCAVLLGLPAAYAGRSPFARPRAPRRDSRPGVIERSDGLVYGGPIYTTRAKKLEMYLPEEKRWLKLRLRYIRKITISIEKEETVREWKFREGGHDDKVYTGRVKLDRKYIATVRYEEKGREKTAAGHLKGMPLYVEHWDGKRYRFFLRRNHSGEYASPEEARTSLTYTTVVDFTRDPQEVKKKLEEAERKNAARSETPPAEEPRNPPAKQPPRDPLKRGGPKEKTPAPAP